MPYLHCPSCRLTAYSAARWSSRDVCARCGTELTRDPRSLFALDKQPDPGADVISLIPLRADLPETEPPPAAA